jgi:IS30 family transposase
LLAGAASLFKLHTDLALVAALLAGVLVGCDPRLRKSITFDNDTTFAQRGLLRTMRDMTTWFCDA